MRSFTNTGTYVLLILGLAGLMACSGGGGGSTSTVGSSRIVTYGSMSLARQASKAGDVVHSITRGVSPQESAPTVFTSPCFLTGQDDQGAARLLYVIPDGTAQPTTKNVVLTDGETVPSPYPNSFLLNGQAHLLFSPGGHFTLYTEAANTAEQITLNRDMTTFDFSAPDAFTQGFTYKGASTGWVSCPVYSPARKTLYFTFFWWVSDTAKGDYVKARIFQSRLGIDGRTFEHPLELGGEMDPFHGIHYRDGKSHLPTDFPTRMGLWWIGRLYVTADGRKAYFTVLNTVRDTEGIMKAGDPFIAPIPNNQDFGDSGVTGIADPRLIWNYACSADIDAEGNFTNVQQLPATVNIGGVNFVSDISDDGTQLVMSHMDLGQDWWDRWTGIYGPDGLALDLTMHAPWDVKAWNGYGTVWSRVEGTWVNLYRTPAK